MIIARITGGLGNQLFQYAMGRRLAALHKTELLLDTTGYGPDGEPRPKELRGFTRPLSLFKFQISAKQANNSEILKLRDDFLTSSPHARVIRQLRKLKPDLLWKRSHVVERGYEFQPAALMLPDNVYVEGFWQSHKYFADISSTIRQELEPVDPSISHLAMKAVRKLKARYGEVVSLHVRRGDLAYAHEILKKKNITHGAPVTGQYIKQAMAKFSPDACFLVFSDSPRDLKWCQDNVRAERIEFAAGESDVFDLVMMRFCDHHIIANSSFSWWAAWLNARPGRRVVAPGAWSAPEAQVFMPIKDLIPEDWTVL
jgi:hypothetical protein